MNIFGSIFHELKLDLDNYLKRRKGRQIYRKYWISKESIEMAVRLDAEIDRTARAIHDNHNRHIRPSQGKKPKL